MANKRKHIPDRKVRKSIMNPTKTVSELCCSGRVCSSCSSCGTHPLMQHFKVCMCWMLHHLKWYLTYLIRKFFDSSTTFESRLYFSIYFIYIRQAICKLEYSNLLHHGFTVLKFLVWLIVLFEL